MSESLSEMVDYYARQAEENMYITIPFGIVKDKVKTACCEALSMGLKPYTRKFMDYVKGELL